MAHTHASKTFFTDFSENVIRNLRWALNKYEI